MRGTMDITQSDQPVVAAFGKALGLIRNITKTQTAKAGAYSYTYASFSDVLDECKRACQEAGLNLTQSASFDGDTFLMVTSVIHPTSGGVLTLPVLGAPMPKDPQALGSASSYYKRYQLMTVFGIATEDDDGQVATTQARSQPTRSQPRQQHDDTSRDEPTGDLAQRINALTNAQKIAVKKLATAAGVANFMQPADGTEQTMIEDILKEMQ